MPERVTYYVKTVEAFIDNFLEDSVQELSDVNYEVARQDWDRNQMLSICLTNVMNLYKGELINILSNSSGEPETVAWKQVETTPSAPFFL